MSYSSGDLTLMCWQKYVLNGSLNTAHRNSYFLFPFTKCHDHPSSTESLPWQSLAFLKGINPILRPVWELAWNILSLPKMLIELVRSH